MEVHQLGRGLRLKLGDDSSNEYFGTACRGRISRGDGAI
jgi:hypothetical protein